MAPEPSAVLRLLAVNHAAGQASGAPARNTGRPRPVPAAVVDASRPTPPFTVPLPGAPSAAAPRSNGRSPDKDMPRRRDLDHSAGPRPASQRQLRVGEELRHALAQLLRPGELRDPALRDADITVTEVRVSPDLKNATAFVMPLAGSNVEETMAGLKRSAPFLKSRLARTIELRQMPNLVFALDTAVDSAARTAALLHAPAAPGSPRRCPPSSAR